MSIFRTLTTTCLSTALLGLTAPLPARAGAQEQHLRENAGGHARDARFTYQGQLSYDGRAVNDTVAMRFRLIDDLLERSPVGTPVTMDEVDVIDGVFDVELDFRATVDANTPYWLEITVNGATLAPCQPIKLARISPRIRIDADHDDAVDDEQDADGNHATTNDSPAPNRGGDSNDPATTTGGGDPANDVDGTVIIVGDNDAGGNGATPGGGGGGGGSASWSIDGSNLFLASGNVGIGTSSPSYALDIRAAGNRALYAFNNAESGNNYGVYGRTISPNGRAIYGQASANSGLVIGVQGVADSNNSRGVYGLAQNSSGSAVGVYGQTNSSDGYAGYFVGGENYFEGPTGFGLDNPLARVDIEGDISIRGSNVMLGFYNVATSVRRIHAMADIQTWTNYLDNGAEFSWWDAIYDGSGPTELMRIEAGPSGDVLANGSFVSGGLDYAEGFKTNDLTLEAGDVVVITNGDWERIERADEAYANLLVGVISENPSFIAGMSFAQEMEIDGNLAAQYRDAVTRDDSAAARSISDAMRTAVRQSIKPVALAGRVPVKVDAGFGAIRPGDRLTSSSTPGHAMRQRRDGPSIGVALQRLDEGRGEVIALIQPCWAAVESDTGALRVAAGGNGGGAERSLQRRVTELEALVAELLTRVGEDD